MKRYLVCLVLLLCIVFGVAAQEPENEEDFEPIYTLGDQKLSINLGLFVPLFFTGSAEGVQSANLTVGGVGSIAWASYLNSAMSVGAEVAGSFSFTPNTRSLFLLHFAGTYTYTLRSYPFEFPLHMALGMSIARPEESTKIDPIVKPGVSFYWAYNSQWSFGVNTKYWWIPQIYTDRSEVPSSDTRFGNFLEISLSALYHF